MIAHLISKSVQNQLNEIKVIKIKDIHFCIIAVLIFHIVDLHYRIKSKFYVHDIKNIP